MNKVSAILKTQENLFEEVMKGGKNPNPNTHKQTTRRLKNWNGGGRKTASITAGTPYPLLYPWRSNWLLQERVQSYRKRTKELVWKHCFDVCISGIQGETPRKLGELRAGLKVTRNECSKIIKRNVLKVSQAGHCNWGKHRKK